MIIRTEPVTDYATIVREARIQRGLAIADALVSVVGAASTFVTRAFAGLVGRAGSAAKPGSPHAADGAAHR